MGKGENLACRYDSRGKKMDPYDSIETIWFENFQITLFYLFHQQQVEGGGCINVI